MWDRAATCCPQPQPHNGALVRRRPAGGGQRLPAHPRLRALLCGAAALAGQHGAGRAGPTAPGPTAARPGPPAPCGSCPCSLLGRGGLRQAEGSMPGPLPGESGVSCGLAHHEAPSAPGPQTSPQGQGREGGGGVRCVVLKPPQELSCSSQGSGVAGGHVLLGRVPREPAGCCSGGRGRQAEECWLCPWAGPMGRQVQTVRDMGCSRLRAELLPSVAVGCRALILGFCRIPWGVTRKAKGLCWYRDAQSVDWRPTAPRANPANLEAHRSSPLATLALYGGQGLYHRAFFSTVDVTCDHRANLSHPRSGQRRDRSSHAQELSVWSGPSALGQ